MEKDKTYAIHEDAHEGGVQTVLRRQRRDLCIRHALGDEHNAYRDSSDKITSEPSEICDGDCGQ